MYRPIDLVKDRNICM